MSGERQIVSCAVNVSGKDPVATHAVEVRVLGAGARAKRAVGRLLLCWGAALPTVLIPLLHFVLPPTLLIAGVVLGVRAFGQRVEGGAGQLPCPKCAAAVSTQGEFGWPLGLYCASCAASIEVRPVGG